MSPESAVDLHPGPLDEALLALGPAPSFARFCEHVSLFEAFVASRCYVPWLETGLAALAKNPAASAGIGGKPYHLWSTQHGRIAVVRVHGKRDGNPKTLTGHAFHRLMHVADGRLCVRRWRHPRRVDPTILERDARLEFIGEDWWNPGALIRLEAGQEVIEFVDGAGVVVGLDSAMVYTTRWAYDRDSLLPVAIVAADARTGRIEHALFMLAQIGSAEDAPGLEVLMRNPVHAVRWSAVRTAVALGHPDSRGIVERALDDPHPHVRRAAAAALPMLSRETGS